MSKKTETIEIRVSPELKAKLAEKSRAEGKTMSGFMRDLVTMPPERGSTQTGETLMTKSIKRAGIVAIPAIALAAVASAFVPAMAVANPDTRVAFAELDIDGDGAITADEYMLAYLLQVTPAEGTDDAMIQACAGDIETQAELVTEAEMQLLDVDGDGSVSYAEMHGVMQRQAAETFLALDVNGDGLLDGAEIIADIQTAEGEDAPALSEDCLNAIEAMATDAVEPQDGVTDDQLGRIMVAQFDTNNDGKVSLVEYLNN